MAAGLVGVLDIVVSFIGYDSKGVFPKDWIIIIGVMRPWGYGRVIAVSPVLSCVYLHVLPHPATEIRD